MQIFFKQFAHTTLVVFFSTPVHLSFVNNYFGRVFELFKNKHLNHGN